MDTSLRRDLDLSMINLTNFTIVRPRNSATGPNSSSRDHPLRPRSGGRAAGSAAIAAGMSGAAIPLYDRIDLGRTLADLVDLQRIRLVARRAGSTLRHAGAIDAGDLWLFREQ